APLWGLAVPEVDRSVWVYALQYREPPGPERACSFIGAAADLHAKHRFAVNLVAIEVVDVLLLRFRASIVVDAYYVENAPVDLLEGECGVADFPLIFVPYTDDEFFEM